MAELGLTLKTCPSLPNPNLPLDAGVRFATPAIWVAGMDDGDWQTELERMIWRSRMTSSFLRGEISPEDMMDVLNDCRIDVDSVADDWGDGIFYL